jgi:hypothetical protein
LLRDWYADLCKAVYKAVGGAILSPKLWSIPSGRADKKKGLLWLSRGPHVQ